jgi:hypothetical protein
LVSGLHYQEQVFNQKKLPEGPLMMKVQVRLLCVAASLCAFVGAATTSAHASPVSGLAFCDIASDSGGNGSNYAIQTPTIAQLFNAESTAAGGVANVSATACATFSASAINFASGSDSTAASSSGVTGGNSLSDFLNYGGTLTGSSYTALSGANGAPGTTSTGSQDDDGTLVVLTGADYLTNGESITLNHDDGALIYVCLIGGLDNCSLGAGDNPNDAADYSLISPAGSGTQTVDGQSPFTFNGNTGAYDFLLVYNSNYTQPSDLQSNIDTGSAPGVTPEPSSLIMLGTGLLGAAGMLRRRFAA